MKKPKLIPGQLPLFTPPSTWELPSLDPAQFKGKLLGFDVETCDPYLTKRGPGFIRGDARVVGFSLSDGNTSKYFPFDHAYGDNLERRQALDLLHYFVSDENYTLIGANLMYEREALWSLGMEPYCNFVDVQIAEPLIDEEADGYSLDALAKRYLHAGKNEDLLREAASAFNVDPKSGLWELNPVYVGPYAEWDAWAPVKIWQEQEKIIKRRRLDSIFELEQKLQPLIFKMRLQGIPVDPAAAKELLTEFKQKYNEVIDQIHNEYKRGWLPNIDLWSGKILQRYCDQHKIEYRKTAKGNPSFNKAFLESASHPFFKLIRKAREYDRLAEVFIRKWILDNEQDGKVHPEWKQLASDDGGTKTGRMAAANPNPQQIPSRTEEGKRIRTLFRTKSPYRWAKFDYSQQEPRILVHFAYKLGFTGAWEVRKEYIDNPDADFYQIMMQMAHVERRPAKDLYLGRCYGMGAATLADRLGVGLEEAKSILRRFDERVPFVRSMADKADQVAQQRGYIKTILGRHRHFDSWEPRNYEVYGHPVRGYEEAKRVHGNIPLRRAFTHKALNSLIQGSAADMTKAAMLAVWKRLSRIPFMQVHDELNYAITSDEEVNVIRECMETAVEISVPMKVDVSVGKTWR